MTRHLLALTGLLVLTTGLTAADTDTPAAPKLAAAFRQACAGKAAAAEGLTVRGADGWLFLRKELRHLGVGRFWGDRAAEVSRATRAGQTDPFPAIVDYHQQCKKRGIELILLPIPPKAVVYPDKIAPSVLPDDGGNTPRLDLVHQEFYKLLREQGVNVVDLTDVFLEHRDDEAGAMYCRQDTHFSGRACVVAAQVLAAHIKKGHWYGDVPKKAFAAETRQVQIDGDLRRALEDAAMPKESLPLTEIRLDGAPIQDDADSPVLLLGDSHCLVFHAGGKLHAKAAGLADQLAHQLKIGIDVLGVRGSGARSARIALYRRGRKGDYLEKKKVIIWCFTAREFTEARGWGKVPLAR